jgi:general secretion pathway protein B
VQVPAPTPLKSQSPAIAGAEAPGKPQDGVVAVSKKAAAVLQPPPGTGAAGSAPAQNVISMAELPLALQQELPAMTISVHAYSGNPRDRMVGINNRMLREGDDVVPGLKLEQITPEGMIFGYKGYSFRRGVK